MVIAQDKLAQSYEELKTELQVCKIGGLFLALYRDKNVPERMINFLKKDAPEHFHLAIFIDKQKTRFPTFFSMTYEPLGRQSTIYHVLGLEALSEQAIEDFVFYLQHEREHFTSKPYSLVFWVTPEFENRLFFSAPDFHHWVFGTYDFSDSDHNGEFLSEIKTLYEEKKPISLENIDKFLEKVIWQYEHWQKVKDSDDEFFIEVMERADLYSYYVRSFCTEKEGQVKSLDDLLDQFIEDDSKNFLTLLGDFGTGKSSFSLHYFIKMARNYLQNKSNRIPLFISLKNYPGELTIEDFIVKEFYQKFQIPLSFEVFQELALHGKFFFLVDGFDEMASLSDQKITVKNLKELTKLTFENILFMTKEHGKKYKANKIFLTCRTHYFLTEVQEREILKADYTVLYRNYATKSNYEISRINLKEFNDKQVEEYILKNTGEDETTKKFLKIIKDTYNLKELSTRPLLLDMIVKTLPTLKDKNQINAADLYREYTNIWIERDDWRSQMTPEGKRTFMWELALNIYRRSWDFSLHYSQLEKPNVKHLKNKFEKEGDDYYKFETTTCTFLNRDRNGNYKFIHKSFMEYFIAEYFFYVIKNKNTRIAKYSNLNNEIIFFLTHFVHLNKLHLNQLDISGFNLSRMDLNGAILRNTRLINVNFMHSDLNRADLTGADLSNAVLKKANLTKAILNNATLKDSDLEESNLSGAQLKNANLRKANLENANLCGAIFNNCNLRGSNLKYAKLNGTSLIKADLSEANLINVNLSKSDISEAKLNDAKLSGAKMTEAILIKANLKKSDLSLASFTRANLTEANLCNAYLSGADFTEAILKRANLHEAIMQGTNFINADLSNAILKKSNLCGANLKWVNLTGANLAMADLEGADLSNAILKNTILKGANLKEAILDNDSLKNAIL